MHFKVFLNLCTLLIIASLFGKFCDGYQMGKGKFESYNGNRYTEAKSINDNGNDTKAFFNMNRNRPPAHDTPASACSCREFISSYFRKNCRRVWLAKRRKLFMQIDPTFYSPTRSSLEKKKFFVALIAKVFFWV